MCSCKYNTTNLSRLNVARTLRRSSRSALRTAHGHTDLAAFEAAEDNDRHLARQDVDSMCLCAVAQAGALDVGEVERQLRGGRTSGG